MVVVVVVVIIVITDAATQVPVSPLGVCPSQISPSPLCPPSPSLISPPNHRIFWILVSCCVNFRAGVRYQGASTPCQLLALEPPPPATSTCVHRKKTQGLVVNLSSGISNNDDNDDNNNNHKGGEGGEEECVTRVKEEG